MVGSWRSAELSKKGFKDLWERGRGEEGGCVLPARFAKRENKVRRGKWSTPRTKRALAEASQDQVEDLGYGTWEFGVDLLQDLHCDGVRRPRGRNRGKERPTSGLGGKKEEEEDGELEEDKGAEKEGEGPVES